MTDSRVGERDGVTAVDQNREQSGEPVDRAFHGEQLGTPVQFDTMHVAVPVRGGLQERRLTIERRVSRVSGSSTDDLATSRMNSAGYASGLPFARSITSAPDATLRRPSRPCRRTRLAG